MSFAKKADIGEKRQTAAASRRLDRESQAILYQGANVSQLGVMFAMDNRTIARKISGLEPIGHRGGVPVWLVREAATRLVKPDGDIEEYILKMDPEDLPARINQRFYAGLRERNKFLEETGELWNTEDVLTTLAAAFGTIKLQLELMQDAVQEQTAFSPQQREILDKLVDGTLEKARVALTEQFKLDPDRDVSAEAEAEVQEPQGNGDVRSDENTDFETDPFFAIHDEDSEDFGEL